MTPADSRQQTADSRQQTADSRQQTADSRQQTADSHNYSQKLRVLYVINNFCGLIGGSVFSLFNLMTDMKKRHNVIPVLLCRRLDNNFANLCHENDIQIMSQRFYSWTMGGTDCISRLKGKVKNFLNNFYCNKKVFNLLSSYHFDLVHSNAFPCNMGDIIAEHFSLPHVWHLREFGEDDISTYYSLPYDYVRSRYARADAVVAISHAVYDSYVNERKLCKPENTKVIYNGVKIPEEYAKKNPDANNISFCITGRIAPGKNLEMAVHACAKLKTLGDKFTLNLIGGVQSVQCEHYAETLRNLIHSCRVDDCVKFWGFRSDVNEILRDMDIGLMLSKREAFGRVTVEYMLNYMPVIGVNTGATPEIVIDGETGYICPIDDSEKLAELMHKFITNPELITSMGKKGRERAVNNFSLERNTDEIYSLYQEILTR